MLWFCKVLELEYALEEELLRSEDFGVCIPLNSISPSPSSICSNSSSGCPCPSWLKLESSRGRSSLPSWEQGRHGLSWGLSGIGDKTSSNWLVVASNIFLYLLFDNFRWFFLYIFWFDGLSLPPESKLEFSSIIPSVDEFEEEKCVVSFSLRNLTILSVYSMSSFEFIFEAALALSLRWSDYLSLDSI